MIAIEITLNGEVKAVFGAEQLAQIAAIVRAQFPISAFKSSLEPEYLVECYGNTATADGAMGVLKWASAKISVGDVVSIRFVETNTPFLPIDRQIVRQP